MTKKDLFNQEVIYGIMFDMTSEIVIGFKSQLRNVILAVVDRLQFSKTHV